MKSIATLTLFITMLAGCQQRVDTSEQRIVDVAVAETTTTIPSSTAPQNIQEILDVRLIALKLVPVKIEDGIMEVDWEKGLEFINKGPRNIASVTGYMVVCDQHHHLPGGIAINHFEPIPAHSATRAHDRIMVTISDSRYRELEEIHLSQLKLCFQPESVVFEDDKKTLGK